MSKLFIYILFISFITLSCKREQVKTNSNEQVIEQDEKIISMEPRNVSMAEFIDEVITEEESSLIQEKIIGDFSFKMIYEPWEALIIKDNSNEISKEKFESDLKGRSTMLYFTLKISNKEFTHKELLLFDLPSQDNYTERLDYYSFKVQNDLKLKIGEDEISCGMAHFERTFGLAPGLTISLAFPISESVSKQIKDKKLKERITVSFDEKIFNNGMVKFSFHPNHINSVPTPVIE